MFRRNLSILIAAAGMALSLCACSGGKTSDTQAAAQNTEAKSMEETSKAGSDTMNKKNVVVTTSFLQDMVEELAGDTVNVELIIPAGEDPHLYVAKPEDYTGKKVVETKKVDGKDVTVYKFALGKDTTYFKVVNDSTLRMVNDQAEEAASKLSYDLKLKK